MTGPVAASGASPARATRRWLRQRPERGAGTRPGGLGTSSVWLPVDLRAHQTWRPYLGERGTHAQLQGTRHQVEHTAGKAEVGARRAGPCGGGVLAGRGPGKRGARFLRLRFERGPKLHRCCHCCSRSRRPKGVGFQLPAWLQTCPE